VNGGIAVVGGYVYRGTANDALNGTYFFGDYGNGNLWSFKYDGTNVTDFKKLTGGDLRFDPGQSISNVSSFGEDIFGRMYVCDIGTGSIYRLDPALSGDANQDGVVNATDLSILAQHWQQQGGALWATGDFTDDGNVNILDLAALANHWQQGGASLSEALAAASLSTSVPEPSGMLSALCCGFLAFRRRHQHRLDVNIQHQKREPLATQLLHFTGQLRHQRACLRHIGLAKLGLACEQIVQSLGIERCRVVFLQLIPQLFNPQLELGRIDRDHGQLF
jgi:hypothetical protein